MSIAYNAREIFNGHEILTGHAVLVRDAKVVDIVPRHSVPAAYRSVHLEGYMLAPALMDLQIYGGNGKLFSAELSTQSLEATYEYCMAGGCSRFMITLATNSMDKFLRGIDVIRQYWSSGGEGLLGLHLEGPFINPAKKGAHLEAFIKKPVAAELRSLLDHGKGVIKLMTLAPEICDQASLDMISAEGIVLSAGHSNATYEQAVNAFYGGIPAATHLFNAMSPLQGREPGMVGAVYDHPEVMSSIVCDGVHVDFASVRISKKIMGQRLYFITDAVAQVSHGEYPHVFRGDRYTLPNGTLSGSALTMLQAVKNGVEKVGIPLPEALRMASLYPATLMGIDHTYGCIKPGSAAEFILIGEDLSLKRLLLAGE